MDGKYGFSRARLRANLEGKEVFAGRAKVLWPGLFAWVSRLRGRAGGVCSVRAPDVRDRAHPRALRSFRVPEFGGAVMFGVRGSCFAGPAPLFTRA